MAGTHNLWNRWWPQSLVGRVFALYSLSLLGFMAAALSLFIFDQVGRRLEDSHANGEAVVHVVLPALIDNAIVGDYHAIQSTLQHAVGHGDFSSVSFTDLKGGAVTATKKNHMSKPSVPTWLLSVVENHLQDIKQPVEAGGHGYGALHIQFSAAQIAGELWHQSLAALGLGALSWGLGLILIYWPLKRWLGHLDRLLAFEDQIQDGGLGAGPVLEGDAPIEIRQTFDVLNRAARSLQDQRERAAVTLSAIDEGVVTLDAQGRVLLANPTALSMMRLSEADVVGRGVREVLPAWFEAQNDLTPWQGRRVSGRDAQDQVQVIESTMQPIRDARGQIVGHVLIGRDVTVQHQLDQRLRTELQGREQAMVSLRKLLEELAPPTQHTALLPPSSAESSDTDDLTVISSLIATMVARMQERSDQLNAIFSISPDGFISFDTRHELNYVSPGFSLITGIDDKDILGLNPAHFAARLAAQCAPGGGVQSLLADLKASDSLVEDWGQFQLVLDKPLRREISVVLQRSRSSTVSLVLHLRDITHESSLERMKSEFVNTAAHELRTPITSIYGFVDLLRMREFPAERRDMMLEKIYRNSEILIRIVNDLLTLSRMDADRGQSFVREVVDLREVITSGVQSFDIPADRLAVTVVSGEQALPVRVDRGKLTQALGNLLSNAYKYSSAPTPIEVRLLNESDIAQEGMVGFSVVDRGQGMTPEQVARVFERFYRADSSGTHLGTGLGMSIVKDIVTLHDGTVVVDSEPGQGTTVTVRLPVTVVTEPQEEAVCIP